MRGAKNGPARPNPPLYPQAMLSAFLNFISRLYGAVVGILVSAGLGLLLWASWGLYREEVLDGRFRREGRPVSVTVAETSDEPRSWRDHLGNVIYLTFRYRQQPYTARFVTDTLRVGQGDHLSLLYHGGLDAFRQPGQGQQIHFKKSTGTSRLVKWSVLYSLSEENQWLYACGFLAFFFFIFSTGTLATITGWHFLPGSGYALLVVALLGGTAFLTYDSWQYVQYYGHLKAHGRPAEVPVIRADRHSYSTRASRSWRTYRYTATVPWKGQERVIPLQEESYEELLPGDALPVLYDPVLDDLMPANYTMDYREFLLTAVAWGLTLYFLWRKITRRAKEPHTTPAQPAELPGR